MDGINGISGCHGLVAGLAYAYMGGVSSLPWMTIGGLAIAGAYTAFLPWNLRTGHNVFLGDAGSYFLGASLATIAVGAFYAGIPFLASIAPLLVYLADSSTTLIRRMGAGEQWYKPHRTHVYQRLTDVGLGHISATIMVSSATAIVWAFVLFASDLSYRCLFRWCWRSCPCCSCHCFIPATSRTTGYASAACRAGAR